ncbi:serine/threonine-protein kinase [Maioricimonas sp. JC845]|uniref:serine/threonine-protein kinase n=1 Tax=Maioricimonas sp. JC845 TaxID=3232138 RepID=UPI00345A1E88
MTTPPPDRGHEPDEDAGSPTGFDEHEQRLFEMLDEYVERGQIDGSKVESPENFPELPRLLDCLSSLESLAEIADPHPPAPPEFGQTLIWDATDGDDSPARHGSSTFNLEDRPFGPYRLIEQIGSGGMGVVYKAEHLSLRSVVALKMIRSRQLATAEEITRFYREARAAAGVSHPNIVAVHDVGEYDGHHYLSMDYVEGQDLASLLRNGPLEPDRAAEILMQVARAADYLHRQGVVHRDLKPSNILLDTDGRPRVTDFGLAKVFDTDDSQTRTGTIIGTPAYMSPEQASGKASAVSPLSDVYSLGAILYEMLTGQPPFRYDNPLDTLLSVIESEPTPPSRLRPGIPADLERICLTCLEKDPERRYPSAGALADDLQRVIADQPITLPATSWWHRLARWIRREPELVSRCLGIIPAATIIQVNYHLSNDINIVDHTLVMLALLLWLLVAVTLQKLQNRLSAPRLIPAAWCIADATFFTLSVAFGARQPIELLMIGYPALIVASGLWFQVRLVWLMTAVSLVGFDVLLLTCLAPNTPRQYPWMYAAALIAIGAIVAHQVRRIRILSDLFERRSG